MQKGQVIGKNMKYFRYLVDLLPVLKSWGATGILIEWEDMFPWEGKVKVSAGCRLGKSPISLQCRWGGCIRRGLFFISKECIS